MPDISIDDVRAAQRALIPAVRRTPLLVSGTLSKEFSADVRLKTENLQHTGSFKIRGASNRLSRLTEHERARGVIAASAGNHAQGVAVAATAFGVRATIVMPRTTPLAKIEATRSYGGEVVLLGDSYDDAQREAESMARERGLLTIPAYNDEFIVAGQGTTGVEIVEDMPDVDVVLVPVGGGGLAAGIGVAVKALAPAARVIGVQVDAAPGVRVSLDAGRPTAVAPAPTIAEGIAVGGPGDVTFPLLQRYLDDLVLVDEDDVAQAMVLLMERSKMVVEGAGAVGVAALMANKVEVAGKRVAVLLSGGNVDINMIARVVEHGLSRAGRYMSLSVGVDDKPGQLARLATLLADSGANVMSVAHQRFGIGIAPGRVHVALLLEVRNRAHAGEIASMLQEHGFAQGLPGGPDFVPGSWAEDEG